MDIITNADNEAAYIKVTTKAGEIWPAFLAAVGAIEHKQTNATATAGATYVGVGTFGTVSGCNLSSATWNTDPPGVSTEDHAPQCSPKFTDYTRRIIHVAILDGDCPSGNSGGPYQFSRYADFFVTESAFKLTGQPALYAEYVESHVAGDSNGMLHRIVQLYRDRDK
jgi:hypothetical protein